MEMSNSSSSVLDNHDDIRWRVFSYLPSVDLLSIEVCSKRWRATVTDDLWKLLLEKFVARTISIEGHRYNPETHTCEPEVKTRNLANVSSTLSLLDRVRSVPMSRLRECLKDTNTAHCIEKKEFQKLLAIRLFFRRIYVSEVSHPNFLFPRWSYMMSEHKMSYYFTIQDLKRERILLSEICAVDWSFRFKHMSDLHGHQWVARYCSDYTMFSEFHADPMNWQVGVYEVKLYVVALIPLRRIQFQGYSEIGGAHALQVEQYPTLTVSRLKDGSWMMENMNVIMKQMAPIPPDKVPVV
jgi:hypothetical protein